MQQGDFFGQLSLMAGEGTAHVVARDSLTCLVLSRTPMTPYAGRGAGTTSPAESPAAGAPPGTCAVDVTSHLHRKLGALARHRTQYPIVPSMLPQSLLQEMLGTEFFCHTAGGSPNAAVSRRAKAPVPGGQRATRHRGTSASVATTALAHLTWSLRTLHYLPPVPRLRSPARSLVTEPTQTA